jgi:DNA-binding NtrC family response regulator
MVAEGNADSLRGFPRLMTGDAVSQGDIARLFDVYLQKPFSCEALTQVIEDARCSSDANTRQAAWTNWCRRKRTQPIVGGSTARLFRVTEQCERQLST